MKTMKMKSKIMTFFVVLFVFAMFVPTMKAKAAENVKRSSNSIDKNVEINMTALNQLGSTRNGYQGGYVTNLKQTGATLNSVTISWTAASGAVGYYLIDQNGNPIVPLVQGKTSITLNLPEETVEYLVIVAPIDANGNLGSESYEYDYTLVSTKPKKVTGIKYNGGFTNNEKLNVLWNDNMCHGFEAFCYNRKGKQVDFVDTTDYRSAQFSKTNTQNIYSVKVRPYVLINGNQKLYGDMSSVFYAVPQPKITNKKSDIKRNSLTMRWKKVTGASKYYIYVSTKKNSGYKKVASVKSSKKTYKITKYKGNTVDLSKRWYYVKIVTYAKFGKKTVKSQTNPQYRACVK